MLIDYLKYPGPDSYNVFWRQSKVDSKGRIVFPSKLKDIYKPSLLHLLSLQDDIGSYLMLLDSTRIKQTVDYFSSLAAYPPECSTPINKVAEMYQHLTTKISLDASSRILIPSSILEKTISSAKEICIILVHPGIKICSQDYYNNYLSKYEDPKKYISP